MILFFVNVPQNNPASADGQRNLDSCAKVNKLTWASGETIFHDGTYKHTRQDVCQNKDREIIATVGSESDVL